LLTWRQAEKVDVLKQTLPIFACMRSLAMRFRGVLHANAPDSRDDWIRDAMGCGIHAMQKFAATLHHDIDAIRNAIREPWINGQTEGQINRLKMLKRAMYGRAGAALLRARMRPLREIEYHQV
jgi:transposase